MNRISFFYTNCTILTFFHPMLLHYIQQPGIKQQLAGRISKLLGVPQPAPDDQSPSFICESFQSKISFLEKAATELSRFKTLARCSLVQHGSIGESPLESRNLKRTKETSREFGVSPDTARQRPQSKQARKRLSFGSLR